METKEIKQFYNTTLNESENTYEYNRWFQSTQAHAGYTNTKSALEKYALPCIADGMQVFELGPGPGTWTKSLLEKAPKAQYDLVDISEAMLEQAADALSDYDNISYITSDILEFVPKKQYDFFFSSRIIEYVPDKNKAIEIIAGSLSSGAYGYIVTKTPQYKRCLSKQVTSKVHQLQVSPKELKILFEKHRCEVKKILHVTCVFPGLRSGVLDQLLTKIFRILPFAFGKSISESYALVFQKK